MAIVVPDIACLREPNLLIPGKKPVGRVTPYKKDAFYDLTLQRAIRNEGRYEQPTNYGAALSANNLTFNGSSYVSLGTKSRGDFANPIAIAFRARYTSTAAMCVCGTFDDSYNAAMLVMLNSDEVGTNTAGKIRLFIRDTGNVGSIGTAPYSARTFLYDGNYHDYVLFVDGPNGNIAIFIDGKQVITTDHSGGDGTPDSFSGSWQYPLAFGALNARGTMANYFTGDIANFKIIKLAVNAEANIVKDYWANYQPA